MRTNETGQWPRGADALVSRLPFSELLISAGAAAPHYDEPHVWIMNGRLRLNQGDQQVRVANRNRAEYGYAGSAATRLADALLRLFGEGAERFALLPIRTRNGLTAFHDLGIDQAINPQRIVAGTRKSPPARSKLRMRWLQGQSVPAGGPKFVPQQLVEVPYIYARGEAILRSPITTGAAAGYSLRECLTRGLLEVIERDAFLLAWLTQARLARPPRPKDRHEFSDLDRLLTECTRYRLSVELRLLPSSFPVSVVAAFMFDETDFGPKIAVGASAAFDPEEAGLKALLEALQLRSWLRSERNSLMRIKARIQPLSQPVLTMRQRAALLFREDYARIMREWIDETDDPPATSFPAISGLELAREVESQGGTVTVVDLSERLPRAVREIGIHVAKVIVPELQPLWLNDLAQDIAWERFNAYANEERAVPWRTQNRVPHPFL
jgi:thiazole/oxazole-forming peptide maturase SagD family component